MYVLSDHSKLFRKCTPGWRGCTIACKRETHVIFYPAWTVYTSPLWVPHLQVNRPYWSLLVACELQTCFRSSHVSLRYQLFLEGEKQRPEISLQFAGYLTRNDIIGDQPLKVYQFRVYMVYVTDAIDYSSITYWLSIDTDIIQSSIFFLNITYFLVINPYVRMVRDDNNEKSSCLCPFWRF